MTKDQIDRRQFVQGGAALAASLTVDEVSNRSYRVAIIGSTGRGNYGHGIDRAWKDIPGTEVVAVADDNRQGLAQVAKRLGVEDAFADYRKMLDKVRPDIVAVCPRWLDRHRDMALAAIGSGAHVYMEKPMCRSLSEADEIVTACEKSNAKLVIAHPTRYSPKLNTVQKLLEEGKIGQVLEYRGRGKEDHRGGGEDLWVLGTHVMDLIRSFGGHPKWCFASVTQNGKPIDKTDVIDGNEGIGPLAGDSIHAMYGMPDGAVATFDSCRNAGGKPSRYGLRIFGSAGIFEFLEGTLPSVKYLSDPSWSPGRSGSKWQDVSSAGIAEPEPSKSDKYLGRHFLAIMDLLNSIEEDRQPLGNVYEARGATEMIVAVFESARTGGSVSLPLENRENPLSMLK